MNTAISMPASLPSDPCGFCSRRLVTTNKYRVVAEHLKGVNGSLLDVGARDRILGTLLDTAQIDYRSADLGAGHDYELNLEAPLALPDRSFDVVVALDVLEHVENAHLAFRELARLASRTLIIALPNLATLPRRWSYLRRASLGTDKYALLPEHQGDRHRWLTIYREINRFAAANAARAGLEPSLLVEQIAGGRLSRILALRDWTPRGLFTERCVFIMNRRNLISSTAASQS